MALPRRPPLRALTASATRVRGGMGSDSQYLKRITMPWQYRALQYYDQIGELHFASHFLARMMSRVRYFPATRKPDGKLEPIESGLPVDLLARIQDPGGGNTRLLYSYGLLSFITGEGILFTYDLGRKWKFLWKDEVRFRDDGSAVRLYPDKRETDEVGVGYRFWTPHPRQSDLPDSPVSSVMDICEELIILTQSVHGTAVTRMTNGILALPQELSFGAAEPVGDEDAENDPFLSDYAEHVNNQIQNPGAAESKVPFTLVGNYDYLDRVTWIKTHDPATDYMEKDLRVEAIKRMALGLDMPPEALLGMTDANHWTAKQVMHDMWRTHGIPKAEQFGDDLSQSYMRPALEEEGYAGAEDVVITYDDSQVVLSPDRTDDADQAYDRGQINDKAYAELKGFEDSYAATEEDKKIFLAIKLRDPNLLKGTPFYVEPPEPPPMAPGPPGSPQRNGDASDGPPNPSRGRTGSRQESVRASAHILGAADLALLRCRELAGIRIRQKCKDCAEGHAPALVAAAIGQIDAGDPYTLVKDGASSFYALLRERGIGEAHAGSLAQTLEIWAAKTLFQSAQPDLPSAFVSQVENAQEASDALAYS